ncbi:acyl-CoA N-acyltransferase [Cylindrobasidium torrendii FP15055 ss-10]|uniref:Acyl-CoA N-acyltransferase n=1 Tax=Cylindrobasidium torrendii FP15055 ss-10 TaxID=1314674 RepID=A0A0D7BBR8_9AGAR|nr:acyl-CoA N-acyltransferase [Cylindrobasidium torrendii FP15055 ss-10]
MTVTIRPATEHDAPSLSRICLLTAEAGKSAEALHDYGELPGLVFSVPYVKLPTTWGFVLEDTQSKTVVGYVVGSTDTRAYEKYAAEHWWPALAQQYPVERMSKPADVRYAKLLGNMFTGSEEAIALSSAHLHINILPEYQRKGWGRKLIQVAARHLEREQNEAIRGKVWLGMDSRNTEAKAFYSKLGFRDIEGPGATMVINLDDI